jgi:hypothetical protein
MCRRTGACSERPRYLFVCSVNVYVRVYAVISALGCNALLARSAGLAGEQDAPVHCNASAVLFSRGFGCNLQDLCAPCVFSEYT